MTPPETGHHMLNQLMDRVFIQCFHTVNQRLRLLRRVGVEREGDNPPDIVIQLGG